MSRWHVRPSPPLRGSCRVPGDKSIGHRALMLSALAEGVSRIRELPDCGVIEATRSVLGALGVRIEAQVTRQVLVHGAGLHGLTEPAGPLDCRSSATTMRLIAGIAAGQTFGSTLAGSPQLSHRPMARIIEPLRRMGARVKDREGFPPIAIEGLASIRSRLRGIRHDLDVASAQVKSCILLAGLYADSPTTVVEYGPSRDHTERLMWSMGIEIDVAPTGSLNPDSTAPIGPQRIQVEPPREPLRAIDLTVPGDISSAAFLIVAACVVPESEIRIEGVGVNPTRTGILRALKAMGARISVENERMVGFEPVADIVVRHAQLIGCELGGDDIATMIDELPVLAAAAALAEGRTVIRQAGELRLKETDRIDTTASELGRMNARLASADDGWTIEGGELVGASVHSHWDHRLAMMLAVAGLVARGETLVDEAQVADDSFPGFAGTLTELGAPIAEDRTHR